MLASYVRIAYYLHVETTHPKRSNEMKLILKAMQAKLIKGYQHSAETGESAKDVVFKAFTPWGGASWFISEGMPVDANGEPCDAASAKDWHLFGYCDLGHASGELGYVMLSQLENLRGPFGLRVERDRGFTGKLNELIT